MPENRQVVSEQSACLETQILEANVRGGTGTAAQLPNGRPTAGKTGTAQSFGAAWFVGYTAQLATAVWMGNAEARVPMPNVGGRQVTGGSYPAEVFHDFMAAAHTLAPIESFPSCFPTRPGRSLDQVPDFSGLEGSDIVCHPVNGSLLSRYLKYFTSEGIPDGLYKDPSLNTQNSQSVK